jgi:hypothetical protein
MFFLPDHGGKLLNLLHCSGVRHEAQAVQVHNLVEAKKNVALTPSLLRCFAYTLHSHQRCQMAGFSRV